MRKGIRGTLNKCVRLRQDVGPRNPTVSSSSTSSPITINGYILPTVRRALETKECSPGSVSGSPGRGEVLSCTQRVGYYFVF